MAQLRKLEGQVQLNCSADNIFEMMTSKQPNIPDICSNKVANFQAQQDSWATAGTTRRWEYVIDGKTEYMVERMEAIDEKKKTMHRRLIEGDFMKHYKSIEFKTQVIPKGNSSCIVENSLEFEKLNEDVPAPQHLLDLSLAIFKDVASHLAKGN